MKKILCLIVFSALLSLPTFAAKYKALIVSGDCNHNCGINTPKIASILQGSGEFDVEVCNDVSTLNADSFKGLSVIVSNWNSFPYEKGGAEKEAKWTPEIRKLYADAVRGGVGHVVFHSGSTSIFEDWKDYDLITMAKFVKGETFHKARGAFKLEASSVEHPITKGFSGAMTSVSEELWSKVHITDPNAQILMYAVSVDEEVGAVGEKQPYAFTNTFGKGRCFTTLLGHSVSSMDYVFKYFFLRGCQWAAGKTPDYVNSLNIDSQNKINLGKEILTSATRKPPRLDIFWKDYEAMPIYAKCKMLDALLIAEDKEKIKQVLIDLSKTADEAALRVALSKFALKATGEDYEFIKSLAPDNPQIAIRACVIVNDPQRADKIFELYKASKDMDEKFFWAECLGNFSEAQKYFKEIFTEALAKSDAKLLSSAGALASAQDVPLVLESINANIADKALSMRIVQTLMRLCALDQNSYAKFLELYPNETQDAKRFTMPLLSIGMGEVEEKLISGFIDSGDFEMQCDALKVLSRWKNPTAFVLYAKAAENPKLAPLAIDYTLAIGRWIWYSGAAENKEAFIKIAKIDPKRTEEFKNCRLGLIFIKAGAKF